MSNQLDRQHLQHLAIAMISMAKTEFSDTEFAQLSIPAIQRLSALVAESIPINYLTDTVLLRHTLHQLQAGHSVEETVMHVFTLAMFRMSSESSNHPLERGIIRQKIIGILPIFENALNQGLINIPAYDRNADALAHIADNSSEMEAILQALSTEYSRLGQ